MNTDHIAAIILAAGHGTRMNSTRTNKVMSILGGKPMLYYTIGHIRSVGIRSIVVVVGFAKENIRSYFGSNVTYAVQEKQLGTADAALCGMQMLPGAIDTVLSVYGDDSYNYSKELLERMIRTHREEQADVTLLTVTMDDPTGLGRIVRDKNGRLSSIVEDKNATKEQKRIREINTGCYVFNRRFAQQIIPEIPLNRVSCEYYLTDCIELAVRRGNRVASVKAGSIPWRGVNRPEELEEARLILQKNNFQSGSFR